jgi:hypothetical protein
MRIGLDLDGTVYNHPACFAEMVVAFHARGHTFHCISAHGLDEWLVSDVHRLRAIGIDPDLIDSSLLHPTRHIHLHLKGKAADRCDLVFDDDSRLMDYTKTPVFSPMPRAQDR